MGSLAPHFLLCFTFGGVSGGAEPWAELEQPLPPCSEVDSHLAHVLVKRQREQAAHMKAVWMCLKGQHFKESQKHPAHKWAGSDFVPHRCGQENEKLFPAWALPSQ